MGTPLIAAFVRKETDKKDRLLDVGIGRKPFKAFSNHSYYFSVDAWEVAKPDLLIDLEKNKLPFEKDSFDVALLMDFIEHLSKKRGEKFLEELKQIVTRKIIVFTPLYWECVSDKILYDPSYKYYNNEYSRHKSLWTVDDFKEGWTRFSHPEGGRTFAKYYFGKWEKK